MLHTKLHIQSRLAITRSLGCIFSNHLVSEARYGISPGLVCSRFIQHRYPNMLNVTGKISSKSFAGLTEKISTAI